MPRNRLHRFSQSLAFAAFAGWVAIGGSLACACTIPVFRYALERWESDRFLVIVYFDGQLTAEQNSAIKELSQRSSVVGGPLNIEVIRYDLSSSSPAKLLDIEQPPADRPLPWVEIRARVAAVRTAVRWQGPLSDAVSQPGLFDSPARREIVRRLLAGNSGVFLLVAPAEQVQQLGKQLETLLEGATDGLSLPQGIGLPGSELYAPIPLEIRFSVLPISQGDPDEQVFLKLLAASAGIGRTDTAYVIPVFGRCRALEAFSYPDVDKPLIEDVGGFLCAACSCRVKQANPGFDLLVSVDWNQRLFGESVPQPIRDGMPPIAASGSSGLLRTPDYLPIPTGNQPATTAEPPAAIQNEERPIEAGRVAINEAAASSTSSDATTFHQSRIKIKVLFLLIVFAVVSGGILGVVIFTRR